MNWKSTATIGVIGGTLATLLATASPSVDRQRGPLAPARSIDTQHEAELNAETARLRGRLRPQIAPSASTRNPFAFADAAAARHPGSNAAAPLAVPEPSTDPIRLPPPFTLVGLAEDQNAGATVMTAILSSPSSLQFVKQGDRIAGGYRVAAISSDSVELLDDEDRPLLLRLK